MSCKTLVCYYVFKYRLVCYYVFKQLVCRKKKSAFVMKTDLCRNIGTRTQDLFNVTEAL